jgi:hypothetical protein
MAEGLAALGSYIGTFFTASGATATAATAAETIPEIVVTGTSTAAAGTVAAAPVLSGGTVAAVGGAGAAAAASSSGAGPYQVPDSGPGPAPKPNVWTTLGEAAAIAQGASSLYTLAQGQRGVSIPPTPGMGQQDQAIANAEQQERARREAAGGLQSTLGTPGGAQGALLNPATLSNRQLLGG